jgi:hypothetical protein
MHLLGSWFAAYIGWCRGIAKRVPIWTSIVVWIVVCVCQAVVMYMFENDFSFLLTVILSILAMIYIFVDWHYRVFLKGR